MEDACGVEVDGPLRAPAPADLLRRVDREPRAARLHAPRARLPRLRERRSRWPRDHREVVERGLRIEEDRQRADRARRRARDPPGQRPRRRLLPGAGARAELAALRERARAGARGRPSRRCAGRPPSTFPELERDYELVALRSTRRRVPDRPRPHRLEPRPRHRRRGEFDDALRRGARRRTPTRCTRGCASAAPTWPGRWPASSSTSSASRRSPREAASEAGLGDGCRNPFRSIVVRAVEILYAFDEALRLIDAYERPDAPGGRVRAAGRRSATACTEAPRGLLYHRYEIDDDRARSSRRGSCRRPRRTRRSIEEDLRELRRRPHRPARRRAALPLRAGDPQLRPVHLLRDPLPRPQGGTRMTLRCAFCGHRPAKAHRNPVR